MYDPSGRISVQIVIKADRTPFAPHAKGLLSATTAEKAAAFDSYAAYFGMYTVNAKEGTVTHHLRDSLVPGRRGTDNVRWFEFHSDDELLLVPMEDGKGGVLARKDAAYELLSEAHQVMRKPGQSGREIRRSLGIAAIVAVPEHLSGGPD
jgi:hypothetical protein